MIRGKLQKYNLQIWIFPALKKFTRFNCLNPIFAVLCIYPGGFLNSILPQVPTLESKSHHIRCFQMIWKLSVCFLNNFIFFPFPVRNMILIGSLFIRVPFTTAVVSCLIPLFLLTPAFLILHFFSGCYTPSHPCYLPLSE